MSEAMSGAPKRPPDEPVPVRIVSSAPVIYADAVSSTYHGLGITKLQFVRFDPDINAVGPPTSVHVVQLVMSAEAFVQTVAFFEHRLKAMVEAKIVTEEFIEKTRALWPAKEG